VRKIFFGPLRPFDRAPPRNLKRIANLRSPSKLKAETHDIAAKLVARTFGEVTSV